jgi:cadmium resistance protein CadD (predicted permease)
VLLAFLADPKVRRGQIVAGQFIGIGILYGASVLASLLSLVIPPAYIGLLGLVPIAMGLKQVWELRNSGVDGADQGDVRASTETHGNVVAVAVVTIANGGDNISIYTPLFASRSGTDIAIIGIVFATMTFLWVAAAHWLTQHRTLGAPIRRYGHRAVPFVLIALGILILYESGSFELL